jgi:hypothetical protein
MVDEKLYDDLSSAAAISSHHCYMFHRIFYIPFNMYVYSISIQYIYVCINIMHTCIDIQHFGSAGLQVPIKVILSNYIN